MGFLDNVTAQKMTKDKAAAFDNLVKQGEQQAIYEKGLADMQTAAQQALMATPPQEPMAPPASANVTSQEIAEAQAILGYQPTMEDISALRKIKSLEQVQGGMGAASDVNATQAAGLANQVGKGY